MSDTSESESAVSTPVSIYGRTYHLRGTGDDDYLVELAEFVDAKMRDVAETTGTADTLKVAILACLNIADEYFKARRSGPSGKHRDEVDRRLARMVTVLDEALAGHDSRIAG